MEASNSENMAQAWGRACTTRLGQDVIVNYLWISKKRSEYERAPMCSVPLESVHRAIENANRYPNASFSLWLDPKTIDDSTHFFVTSYLYAHSHHRNINIRNLRDIPAYTENPIFNPDKNHDIWARCDLGRYLVLEHVLLETKPDYAIYSDLDMKDVCVDEACRIMDTHGLAIAAYRHEHANGLVDEGLENGYLGVSRHLPPAMNALGRLIQHVTTDAQRGYHGFNSFVNAACDYFGLLYSYKKPAMVSCRLDPKGTCIPARPEIRELGLT
jgi:hypothetical protein